MAIRNIREYGEEVLTKKCKEVKEMNPRTRELIEDMLDTMYEANGVGLAAPQVTYVMNDLIEAGFDVDSSATTVSEATASILKALN